MPLTWAFAWDREPNTQGTGFRRSHSPIRTRLDSSSDPYLHVPSNAGSAILLRDSEPLQQNRTSDGTRGSIRQPNGLLNMLPQPPMSERTAYVQSPIQPRASRLIPFMSDTSVRRPNDTLDFRPFRHSRAVNPSTCPPLNILNSSSRGISCQNGTQNASSVVDVAQRTIATARGCFSRTVAEGHNRGLVVETDDQTTPDQPPSQSRICSRTTQFECIPLRPRSSQSKDGEGTRKTRSAQQSENLTEQAVPELPRPDPEKIRWYNELRKWKDCRIKFVAIVNTLDHDEFQLHHHSLERARIIYENDIIYMTSVLKRFYGKESDPPATTWSAASITGRQILTESVKDKLEDTTKRFVSFEAILNDVELPTNDYLIIKRQWDEAITQLSSREQPNAAKQLIHYSELEKFISPSPTLTLLQSVEHWEEAHKFAFTELQMVLPIDLIQEKLVQTHGKKWWK